MPDTCTIGKCLRGPRSDGSSNLAWQHWIGCDGYDIPSYPEWEAGSSNQVEFDSLMLNVSAFVVAKAGAVPIFFY